VTAKQFTLATTGFEAARHVDILPVGHRSRGLHGHSFQAQVRAALPAQWANFAGAEVEALRERLAQCIAPLDYSLLNDRLDIPTDENLARWLRQQLDVPGIQTVGIQSTRDQGVDLDESGHAHIWRRFRFEAAHQLPNVPAGHQCGRMHGHGFEVILHADQNLHGQDMGVDFDHLANCWQPLHAQLNHNCLNDIPGLENPTSELLAAWIWDRIRPTLAQLSWVTVYETATAGCHYNAQSYRIWKEQGFESALRLKHAPATDRRHNLHGHSYVIRLHLSAPIDEVMGWTVDYGDVKEIFKPVYARMDHHRLDQIDALEDGDVCAVLQWIKSQMTPHLPQLDRIDLFETPGCGALLCWGAEAPALPA
jgi:6-pyruvoyltetrahydropterin/6-carboxytetrahydropterin synthase